MSKDDQIYPLANGRGWIRVTPVVMDRIECRPGVAANMEDVIRTIDLPSEDSWRAGKSIEHMLDFGRILGPNYCVLMGEAIPPNKQRLFAKRHNSGRRTLPLPVTKEYGTVPTSCLFISAVPDMRREYSRPTDYLLTDARLGGKTPRLSYDPGLSDRHAWTEAWLFWNRSAIVHDANQLGDPFPGTIDQMITDYGRRFA